jgi:hypothetical protein
MVIEARKILRGFPDLNAEDVVQEFVAEGDVPDDRRAALNRFIRFAHLARSARAAENAAHVCGAVQIGSAEPGEADFAGIGEVEIPRPEAEARFLAALALPPEGFEERLLAALFRSDLPPDLRLELWRRLTAERAEMNRRRMWHVAEAETGLSKREVAALFGESPRAVYNPPPRNPAPSSEIEARIVDAHRELLDEFNRLLEAFRKIS